MAKQLAVFCDFDGTITERDMIIAVCEKFCPPGWERVKDDILSRKKTVRDGVAELFAQIPSRKSDDIIAYAKEVVRWRPGFEEFLQFCKDSGIWFIVCSGGIDFFVKPLLKPFQSYFHKTFIIPADLSQERIRLRYPYGCETEGLCKVKVMDEFPDTIKILIGDSITDVHGAHHADRVFARGGLKGYLDQDKVSYHPFETFLDVITNFHSCAKPS
jgi:2-hydroxy-3-keto-5-methylthiopentenyl-1-phosphate phosphatase